MAATIGIDVGGTKAIAVVTIADRIVTNRTVTDASDADPVAAHVAVTHRVYRTHTAWGPQAIGDLIVGLVDECRAATGEHPVAVGLAVAGWLRPDRQTVIVAANLGLADDRLPDRVAARIGVPVVMENDGNAAAVAESRFGAAYGSRVSLALTVGTGLGGGVIVGNRILAGGRGLAGELGHLCFDPDGPLCVCGASGCLEAYACGPSILRWAVAAGVAARTAADVVAAARSGDIAAGAVIASAGQALGHGVVQMCAVVDPEVVTVGGGLAVGAGELLLDPIRQAIADRGPLRAIASAPQICAAACGSDAGALGAASLAHDAAGLAHDVVNERSCR
jgi:glucokinase